MYAHSSRLILFYEMILKIANKEQLLNRITERTSE